MSEFEQRINRKKRDRRIAKRKQVEEEEGEVEGEINHKIIVPDIWEQNPSYKDISNTLSIGRILFLMGLLSFLITSMYMISTNIITAIAFGVMIIIVFIFVFNESFYNLSHMLSQKFGKMNVINPFEGLVFWTHKGDPSFLYYSNKRDGSTVGVRMLKVAILPDKVSTFFGKFIKVLSKKKIAYTYQSIMAPLNTDKGIKGMKRDKNRNINSETSQRIEIYFSVYHQVFGVLNEERLKNLRSKLIINSEFINAAFSSVYHFKVQLLEKNDMINALRTFVLKEHTHQIPNKEHYIKEVQYASDFLYKGALCAILLIYTPIGLIMLTLSSIFILIIEVALFFSLIYLWWGGLLSMISNTRTMKNDNIILIDPFKGWDFLHFKEIPDCLFIHVDKEILIGMKILNLSGVIPPIICNASQFFRTIIDKKINFSYSLMMEPINFETFVKEGFNFLKEKIKHVITSELYDEKKQSRWYNQRSRIHRTILALSVSSYRNLSEVSLRDILEVKDDLKIKAEVLEGIFSANFENEFVLEYLKDRRLISGFLGITLKNKLFRRAGTHLNYLLFQGRAIGVLNDIVDQFKRGIESRIAAEFITPVNIENYIKIGNSINTENIELESGLGLTLEQLNSLLITNGTQQERNNLRLKILSELIKAEIPSIYFDFKGDATKVIRAFQETKYERDILTFKFGKDFFVNIFESGVPYDTENLRYLDYLFDVFALAYQKNEREIEQLKKTIMESPEMDLNTISFSLDSQNKWGGNYTTDSVKALIHELREFSDLYFHNPEDKNNVIGIKDFIANKKTIIIDLSVFNDLKNKVFTVFVLLAKIIHYIKHENEETNDYIEKVLIIPNVDIMFYNQYLDKFARYGKLDKFLEPLQDYGYGLIFSASQVRNLHDNISSYCKSYITFKTNNEEDIRKWRSLLSLHEFTGKGTFNSSRRNMYQIEYMSQMKPNEFIIKRDDNDNPYPGIVDTRELDGLVKLNMEQIYEHMEKQGYNLRSTQRNLTDQIKKTLLEKDLGKYIIYKDDIINFLEGLKKLDAVGNNFLANIKKQLMKTIYPTASKITKDKNQLHSIRDNLFTILFDQGYIVKGHPMNAAGGESLRTSYSVGDKFAIALTDYFETKRTTKTHVSFEEVEKNPCFLWGSRKAIERKLDEKRRLEAIKEAKFKDFMAKETGANLMLNLFHMNQRLNKLDYKGAMKLGGGSLQKFLVDLYKMYFNYETSEKVSKEDLEKSMIWLAENEKIPFDIEQLRWVKSKISIPAEELSEEEEKKLASEMYEIISNFYRAIQSKISEAPEFNSTQKKAEVEELGDG